MNKRAVALIMALLVILVLSIILGVLFFKTVSENSLVQRQINSTRAFWVAEAGLARAIANLPNSPTDGTLGSHSFQTTTTFRANINSSDYYDIISTGTVTLASGADITRVVKAVVKRGPVDASKFKYGIQAANDLCWGGGCSKTPENYLDPDVCPDGPCWKEFDAAINFSDLFGYSQADVEAVATHYTEDNFPGVISGVTWVDVTPGDNLVINGTETGTGVLIIDGDVRVEGTYQFHGIMYVLGNLTARGTYDAYGSTIVASTTEVDEVNGTPEFHYNETDITDALAVLSGNFKEIVSWWEN